MKRPRRRQPRVSGHLRSGSRTEAGSQFFEDFVDLLAALNRERARFFRDRRPFAFAAAHGVPRATGDFDVCQIGIPPRRIDVMTSIDGVEFAAAWHTRLRGRLGPARSAYIGRAALLRNKRAMSRSKDVGDVELLEAQARPRRRSPPR